MDGNIPHIWLIASAITYKKYYFYGMPSPRCEDRNLALFIPIGEKRNFALSGVSGRALAQPISRRRRMYAVRRSKLPQENTTTSCG